MQRYTGGKEKTLMAGERGSGSKNDNDGCTREVMYLTDDRSIAIANTKAVNFMFHNNLGKWVNPSIP